MNRARHTYEYEVNPSSATAPAQVVRLVGQGKRVLEIGCGPGSITKILAEQGQCEVTGLERDPEAIERVKPYCRQVLQADLEASDWPERLRGLEKFDVVVAADVLEHLYDPWATLSRMKEFINADGYLVISLPHAGHAAVLSCLIAGDFQYRDWGLLDRTHIRFFGFKNIEPLFAQAGLKIVDVRYVAKTAEETEFAAIWSQLPAKWRQALAETPYSQVYQIVVKAIPLERPGTAIPLQPLPLQIHHQAVAARIALTTRLRNAMPPRLKQFVRRGFRWLGLSL